MSETSTTSERGSFLRGWRFPEVEFGWEVILLLAITAYLLAFGLVPILGGDQIGLVGADEPRYAQVAREMLARKDYVTPILYGMPWLEKPALFYWRAMFSFEEFGVSDWAARLPSTSFAFALVILTFLHMRRFRPGGHLHAALITASCAAIIGFARGASTDMQLAAPFCIGMLGWYAWYETGSKFWLFDLYFFVGLGTLAKGPIAPAMAFAILVMFAALRREWSVLRRTFWWPGAVLYLAMVLPWYIAVTRRNPDFLRVFFLQHNLERFATDRFHHHQPVWYYLPVLFLGLMPWTILAGAAFVDGTRQAFAEWRARRDKNRYLWLPRAGDAFPEFLVLWAIFPLIFFSFSGSKLPGYILPSIPPITILTGDYLNRRRAKLPRPLLLAHALFVGLVTAIVLLLPSFLSEGNHVPHGGPRATALLFGALATVALLAFTWRYTPDRLRSATMVPVVLLLFFLLRMNGHLLDQQYSARPVAHELQRLPDAPETVAVLNTRRDMEYGLAFYLNRRVVNYMNDGIPLTEHILVAHDPQEAVENDLPGREVRFVSHFAPQDVDVYWVGPASQP